MDYQKILKIAQHKLRQDSDVANEIKELISGGSTGGEIASMVGKYLKDLENINENAYLILKVDINDYLSQCKKHGLLID